jgi:hypothetical protein
MSRVLESLGIDPTEEAVYRELIAHSTATAEQLAAATDLTSANDCCAMRSSDDAASAGELSEASATAWVSQPVRTRAMTAAMVARRERWRM